MLKQTRDILTVEILPRPVSPTNAGRPHLLQWHCPGQGGTALERYSSQASLHWEGAESGPEAGGSGKERVSLSGAFGPGLGMSAGVLVKRKVEKQGSLCRCFQ